MKYISFISVMLLFSLNPLAQGTAKKVLYFTFDSNPSVLDTGKSNVMEITLEQLKKIKKINTIVSGNLSYSVYFTGKGFTEAPEIIHCIGDTISPDVKKVFPKVCKGTFVIFDDILLVETNGKKHYFPSRGMNIVE